VSVPVSISLGSVQGHRNQKIPLPLASPGASSFFPWPVQVLYIHGLGPEGTGGVPLGLGTQRGPAESFVRVIMVTDMAL
jgi:hypothetical protein